ncbi:hypothetical protein NP493_59g03001 [Ridgeia piscesae]|uniref:Uncharacterized protein n=1 Tax=Ridgeia piscesae TaxID=27915 RepID=A0AAD9UIU5_RIDPI|nr:hypothetical protein NP493_59g03001 [Ridgeia piscesae]
MASHSEASFENRTSQAPRLPLIGHGCLISPQPISKESTVRDDMGSWAMEVRQRLQESLDAGKPPSLMDVAVLKQHLMTTCFSRVSWIYLGEVLLALIPFKEYLQGKLEMHHYVARLLHHLNQHAGRLYKLHIAETLRLVFFKEVEEVLEGNFKDKMVYNNPQYTPRTKALSDHAPPVRTLSTPAPQVKSRPKAVYEEEKDIFTLDRFVKGLSLWDLSQSLPDVALEVATREAVWNQSLGKTFLALNTQIPLPEPPVPAMTGRDAVEYFTWAYHTGKIKYMYFNVAHNRSFQPYDLVAVPENKFEPEHYVFSTFGVLHVSPDYPSESMSLAEWQCEAVLFNAISKMAFFKNYLYRKMFTRWRGNVHFAHFARLRYSVRSKLLHTVHPFGGALLQAAKLCQEVLALEFLPIDNKTCFKLIQLENFVRYRSVQATQLMDKFFSYHRQIVETTCKESFTKLQHCHKQVKHKAVFTRESLYLQRINSEEREKNLREAIEETRRLGNLVQLLDQLVLGHLVMIARDSVTRFVYETMRTSPNSSSLTMSPPKEKFISVLNFAFANIPTLLCESVQPLKGRLPGSKVLEEEDIEGSLASSRTGRMSSRTRQHARNQSPSSKSPSARRTARQVDSVPEEQEETPGREEPASATSRLGFVHTPQPYTEAPLISVTPAMVQERGGAHHLEVLGVGFMGQYHPINSTNLREKLDMDEAYQDAIRVHHSLMDAAIEEVEDYCETSAWLNEINEYCNNWTEKSVMQLEGAAAFTIEQKLNELRQWAERVRLFDRSYTTENNIFYVDCSGIHDSLIPTLDDICQQICSYVATDAGERSNMKDKQTSMGGFAAYARNMNSYKANIHNYHRTVDYIKSLFEVCLTLFVVVGTQ